VPGKTDVQWPLEKIAKHLGGQLDGDGAKTISGAAPFETAGAHEITFAAGAKFLKRIGQTGAGAVIVPMDCRMSGLNLIRVPDAQVAFARVLRLFYPAQRPRAEISPWARIGTAFSCGQAPAIAAFVSIGDRVGIGHRATIHPGTVIGDDVKIGDDVLIYPNVTIGSGTCIGHRVVIQAGTVIGSDGFGYAHDGSTYHKIIHRGIVQIDDDVEIGAGNTIDRATFGKTWIQRGVKTDNLVQIAHNVTVGQDTVIVAQVGISGSVTVGKHVILAGQAGISGHLSIGDNAIIGPQSGIAQSVPEGEVVSGSPEMPHRTWLRVQRILPGLPDLKKQLSRLESRLAAIEAHREKTHGTDL
jgi:UDP-3-O-[3-hydroxymyristoyl] glucosamine N-acyltransferase